MGKKITLNNVVDKKYLKDHVTSSMPVLLHLSHPFNNYRVTLIKLTTEEKKVT